ncbi:hypothetical protein TH25_21285 [Thalassospira profundimaris]|uniref:Uncharacterized protein n=1 Tax=Thalassospira profundimaris TaxID=502049 RepID=A0A367WQG2_9PROT|nr:hypothetical protein [Thalassospira profundimaris]RCK43683.1 hypothetical protein TH25_21285 [Thalassospira profundimaris]
MKAGSAVLTRIQNQMTMFGLPMPLMMLCVVIGAMGLVVMVILEIFWLMLPTMVLGIAGAWLFFIRKIKDNMHFDRELSLPLRFWRTGHPTRLLNAGRKDK